LGLFVIVHSSFFILFLRGSTTMMYLLGSSIALLLAQTGGGSATYSASWALVLFCVILGLLVALNPPRRTTEIKKKD
jgi:hypothetical protein